MFSQTILPTDNLEWLRVDRPTCLLRVLYLLDLHIKSKNRKKNSKSVNVMATLLLSKKIFAEIEIAYVYI